jgi:hypothetical protein
MLAFSNNRLTINTPAALRDLRYAGRKEIDDHLAVWIAGLDDLFANELH